jgi:hypothetical protein
MEKSLELSIMMRFSNVLATEIVPNLTIKNAQYGVFESGCVSVSAKFSGV